MKKIPIISKYFLQDSENLKKNEDQDTSCDSPYKTISKKPKENWNRIDDSFNDENDFKTSSLRRCKSVTKIKPTEKKKTKSKKKQVQKSNLIKNFGVSSQKVKNFNPEHVNFALALSESLQSSVGEDKNEKLNEINLHSKDNVLSLRETLEKFSNKSNNPNKINSSFKNKVIFSDNRKKKKFKFVNPILYLRKDEDRNKIIEEKVSSILSENIINITSNEIPHVIDNFLLSENLKKILCEENNLFSHVALTQFHVEKLGFFPCKEKADRFLKNWSNIPGRDTSPTSKRNSSIIAELEKSEENTNLEILRQDMNSGIPGRDISTSKKKSTMIAELEKSEENTNLEIFKKNMNGSLNDSKKRGRSLSPDLFDSSDEDINYENKTQKIDFQVRSDSINENLIDSNKSLNVTDYVMKILKHNSTNSLLNISNCLENFKEISTPHDFSEHTDSYNSSNNKKLKNESSCSSEEKLTENSLHFKAHEDSNMNKNTSVYIDLCDDSNEEADLDSLENSIILSDSDDSLPKIIVRKKKQKVNKIKEDEFENIHNDDSSESENICKSPKVIENNHSYEQCLKDKSLESFEDERSDSLLDLEKKTELVKNSAHEIIETENSYENIKENIENENNENFSPLRDEFRSKLNEELQSSSNIVDDDANKTPTISNQKIVVVKVNDVTPMINYDKLDTPEINKHLHNFGVKPLKRKRGAMFLKYIYESTHPTINIKENLDLNPTTSTENNHEVKKSLEFKNNENYQELNKESSIEIVGDSIAEKDEDLIFEQKRSSKKIASCAVPLHIVWFNYVSSHPQIKENILLYQPLQLEEMHANLKNEGYKFKIEDLLTFLDKKCITIKRNYKNKGDRY